MRRISPFAFGMPVLPILAAAWRLDVYVGDCEDLSLDDAECDVSSRCRVLDNWKLI